MDRYGRLLAYVWLADGRLLEEEQLRSGWATTYIFAGRPVSLSPAWRRERERGAAGEARRLGRLRRRLP